VVGKTPNLVYGGFSQMMIEVLGVSCQKCEYIYRLIVKLVKENHVAAQVEFVQDMDKILRYNIIMTPAIVIDGKTVCVGRTPTRDEIMMWIGCGKKK
jgi:small redox-active disulfide protein 2